MDEDPKLRLVNPAPEPDPWEPNERFLLALERLGDQAPAQGSLAYWDLREELDPRPFYPHLDRWPKGYFVPVDEAERQELKKAAAWLRSALTELLKKHVLPFRPKPSASSTPPTPPNPSRET